jgi:hypothetical protein
MANIISKYRQITITAALAEGNSIRSIERMTGVQRDTIMCLDVRIGQGRARILEQKMRDLNSTRIWLDEIWGFVGKKDENPDPFDDLTGFTVHGRFARLMLTARSFPAFVLVSAIRLLRMLFWQI